MTKYKIASNTCVFGSVVLCLHHIKRFGTACCIILRVLILTNKQKKLPYYCISYQNNSYLCSAKGAESGLNTTIGEKGIR